MKLYYSPGACSLSPHIVLEEAGLAHTLEKVNLRKKLTEAGADYLQVNSKGYVPALQLDSGELLTEGPAIVQYLADLAPNAGLAPPAGTLARARLQEWLTFIGTELHKTFAPLFHDAPEAVKAAATARLEHWFAWLAPQLTMQPYLLGPQFSVADAYLFTVLGWTRFANLPLDRWPSLVAYLDRVGARPSVQAALKAEGLA